MADFAEHKGIISLMREELNLFFLNKSFYDKKDVKLLDELLFSYLKTVGKE